MGRQWGLVGSGCMREGEAARRGAALTRRPGSTVPPDSVFKPIQIYFKRIQNSPNFD
jgi:hypothetical protein